MSGNFILLWVKTMIAGFAKNGLSTICGFGIKAHRRKWSLPLSPKSAPTQKSRLTPHLSAVIGIIFWKSSPLIRKSIFLTNGKLFQRIICYTIAAAGRRISTFSCSIRLPVTYIITWLNFGNKISPHT